MPSAPHRVEVLTGLRAIQGFRAALAGLAQAVVLLPKGRGTLLLVDPGITDGRLAEEWLTAERIYRPELLERLALVAARKGVLRGWPKDPDAAARSLLAPHMPRGSTPAVPALPRADFGALVLQLLVHQWLQDLGPVTTDWLQKQAGCSYPTVAAALKELGAVLQRHHDRRVELRRFPRDEWAALLASAERVRGTVRYADGSGQPRSAESLLKRLKKLGRTDVAVGGAIGARRHHPGLDLAGTPRLDLTLHCPRRAADLSFVESLDPALQRTEDRAAPASLVIHLLRRRVPLFVPYPNGVPWADPVECLLDLHEAHLEPQAEAFVAHLSARRRAPT